MKCSDIFDKPHPREHFSSRGKIIALTHHLVTLCEFRRNYYSQTILPVFHMQAPPRTEVTFLATVSDKRLISDHSTVYDSTYVGLSIKAPQPQSHKSTQRSCTFLSTAAHITYHDVVQEGNTTGLDDISLSYILAIIDIANCQNQVPIHPHP